MSVPVFDTGVAWLPPVGVAVPVAAAGALTAIGKRVPRVALDIVAMTVALFVIGTTATLLDSAARGRVITWSAHWEPHHGFSVGIVLVSDPVGAGLALLTAGLVAIALLYSWRYVESVEGHYHALILLFLAGMQGFALTGDLFDMFVFFELMGASAYALTGTKVEDVSALQGALNFGVINSLGAYGALMGVGLLYARTGQLGLPQLGQALAHHHPDALVIAAFVLVVAGFLVKAAMVPFHFWLADAHAVAPSPVCVLFSGIMVPLGVYAAFRVYWVVFSQTLPAGEIRRTFVILGLVTAITGAAMCVSQRHLKRLLAHSTIAHVGLFLVALGCLTPDGTAGAAIYVVGHAGVKSALFLLAGLMLNRYGSVDEIKLHGRGRRTPWIGWMFVLGGLALAGLPPFGTGLGKAISEEASSAAGYPWGPALYVVVSALTGGAVIRAGTRVYFGLGPVPRSGEGRDRSTGEQEERDTPALKRIPATMTISIVVLLAGALAVGVIPAAHTAAEHAAQLFIDPSGYQRQALLRAASHAVTQHSANWTGEGLALGFTSAVLALGVAAAGIWSQSIVDRLPAVRMGQPVMSVLHKLHSGHVGDYVAWWMMGLAMLGGFIGLPLR